MHRHYDLIAHIHASAFTTGLMEVYHTLFNVGAYTASDNALRQKSGLATAVDLQLNAIFIRWIHIFVKSEFFIID